MKKISDYIIPLTIILSLLTFTVYKLDTIFQFRWLVLLLYLLPIIIITTKWIVSLKLKIHVVNKKYFYGLLIILIVAVATRLYLLINYPFVSLGDEIREPGLNALLIKNGVLKNFFGYGAYEGYGIIIPALTSLLYLLIGSSVLVFRLPAVLSSILDIVLIFILLILVTKNRKASLLGAFSLVSLPLHLYYSRTELVVIMSSLFSTIMLAILYILYKRKLKYPIDFVMMGLVIGITFNLYSAIKAMGLIVIGIIIIGIFYQYGFKKYNLKKLVSILILFIIYIFVGFGPLIFNTNIDNFFNTKRLILKNQAVNNQTEAEKIPQIINRYQKSLLVWINQPTTAWYPDKKPILSPIIFLVMFLGIISAFIYKNKYLLMILSIAAILHLTNSALTEYINMEQRLSPLYPISALFIGTGFSVILNKLKIKPAQNIFTLLIIIWFTFQTGVFFINQPANINKPLSSYLFQHTMYFIQKNHDKYKADSIYLTVSPNNYDTFNLLHYQEHNRYFLPDNSVFIKKDINVNDNTIYINKDESEYLARKYIILCKRNKYQCPLNFQNNITIFY